MSNGGLSEKQLAEMRSDIEEDRAMLRATREMMEAGLGGSIDFAKRLEVDRTTALLDEVERLRAALKETAAAGTCGCQVLPYDQTVASAIGGGASGDANRRRVYAAGGGVMKTSAIGWTDFSGGDLNFATGCTPVSAGCANCYARAIYRRFGRDFAPTWHRDKLARLLTTHFPQYSSKRGEPHRPMAFVCDTGDLFHEDITDEQIKDAMDVMHLRTDVNWQILTKRAERMLDMIGLWPWLGWTPPPNIWLGVSVEDQATAEDRIPLLLATPADVHFVSVEPMLGPVDLTKVICLDGDHLDKRLHNIGADEWLHWVICGAESGPHRRPFDAAWAEALYDQCHEAGVAFFGKQDSALRPGAPLLIHGREVKEWPEEATP